MLRGLAASSAVPSMAIAGVFCLGALQGTLAQAQEAPQRATAAPLAFKVEWVRPASQADTKARYTPIQQNITDPKVEIKYYGAAAKQILTTGQPGSDLTPYGVWSGTAEGPFAITFAYKDSYLDFTGLANVKWPVKTSAFHVVRPVIKVDGTLLVGDVTFASVPKLGMHELSLTNVRWVKLDPTRVVTLNSGPAAANPNNEVWAPAPDLSKIEEIGFADLMPGSGHGQGGYIQLGNIEVYAKTSPRTAPAK